MGDSTSKERQQRVQRVQNQIPQELIRRIILGQNQEIGRSFSGTYLPSKPHLKTAGEAGAAIQIPQTGNFGQIKGLWDPREVDPPLPNVDSSGLDDILDLITPDHLARGPLRLFKLASKEDFRKAAGPKAAPDMEIVQRKNDKKR